MITVIHCQFYTCISTIVTVNVPPPPLHSRTADAMRIPAHDKKNLVNSLCPSTSSHLHTLPHVKLPTQCLFYAHLESAPCLCHAPIRRRVCVCTRGLHDCMCLPFDLMPWWTHMYRWSAKTQTGRSMLHLQQHHISTVHCGLMTTRTGVITW